jgi:hypothetical protein
MTIILFSLYRLDLKVQGQVKLDGKIYETNNEGSYKRSYLPLQTGNLKGRVDSLLKEVEFEVKYHIFLQQMVVSFWIILYYLSPEKKNPYLQEI